MDLKTELQNAISMWLKFGLPISRILVADKYGREVKQTAIFSGLAPFVNTGYAEQGSDEQ